jgi:phospholipid/cholesterol/gamma-HCH transport system substrate-binding protein
MRRLSLELVVGLFFLAGLASFTYLTLLMGEADFQRTDSYRLEARFTSASGLKVGAPVEMAGVVIGEVTRVSFDPERFEAVVELTVPEDVMVPEDTIASVSSTGLIGGKYLKLSPGASDLALEPGGVIYDTEPSVNLEELIGKYIFESN